MKSHAFIAAVVFSLSLPAFAQPATETTADFAPIIERLVQSGQHDAAVKDLTTPLAASALVKALADVRPEIRAGAAEILCILYNDPAKIPGYKSQKFWEDRIAKLKTNTPMVDVFAILLPDRTTLDDRNNAIISGNGAPNAKTNTYNSTTTYRLDDSWTVLLCSASTLNKPDDEGLLQSPPPELRASAKQIWAYVPASFNGLWTLYFVNGQKCYDIHCKDGKYDGPFEAFYDTGAKRIQRTFINHVCDGPDLGFFPNGKKMYEGRYVAGKQEGIWTNWDEQGKTTSIQIFKDGQLLSVH